MIAISHLDEVPTPSQYLPAREHSHDRVHELLADRALELSKLLPDSDIAKLVRQITTVMDSYDTGDFGELFYDEELVPLRFRLIRLMQKSNDPVVRTLCDRHREIKLEDQLSRPQAG